MLGRRDAGPCFAKLRLRCHLTVALACDSPCPPCSSDVLRQREDAAAIRAALHQAGELSAAAEPRRRFPGFTDNRQAIAIATSSNAAGRV
jgi:hypothetical protein